MSIFSKIGSFFMGGAATAGVKVAEGVADIVERWHPSDAKNHQMTMEVNKLIQDAYTDARKNDTPMSSGIPIIDAFVNGINRLIRPWVTITVIGSLFGYWELPAPGNIAPEYWVIAQLVLGFWFGGRLVTKDIPAALRHMRG